jgi:hypothetical protein
MSRISRYQQSIDKFIQTKSSLTTISDNNKSHLNVLYKNIDHLIAICLVSILNNKCKKEKLKFHGYYIASGIDVGFIIAQIMDRYNYYKNEIGDNNLTNLLPELLSTMYQSLSGNIDSLKLNVDLSETMRINQYCINYMSQKIHKLVSVNNYETTDRIHKTDFIDYKFKDDKAKENYRNLKYISDEKLLEHIDNKYGTICKMALIFGWLFGLGDEKELSYLEELGKSMGRIFKIAYDFDNIDSDLEKTYDCDNNSDSNYSSNIVINMGIKNSVVLFLDNKAKLVEGLLKLKIWSTTIKEILDLIEQKIDDGLERSNIDEKLEFSDFSSLLDK